MAQCLEDGGEDLPKPLYLKQLDKFIPHSPEQKYRLKEDLEKILEGIRQLPLN